MFQSGASTQGVRNAPARRSWTCARRTKRNAQHVAHGTAGRPMRYTVMVNIDEDSFEEYPAAAFLIREGCLQIDAGSEAVYYPLTSILRFSVVEEEANG